MMVFLQISMLIFFPKLEPPCLLRWSLIPLPSYCQTCYTQYHKWRCHFSTFPLPSQLSRFNSLSGELVLSLPTCFELSAFASMVKAFYYCCKSVVRKHFLAAPVDTFYRTLIISFLSFLWASVNLSLTLQSAPWHVAWLLGLCKVSLLLHASEGIG